MLVTVSRIPPQHSRTRATLTVLGATLALTLSMPAFGVEQPDAERRASPNSASLEAVEATHDFGAVPQGEPAVHEFELRNTGDETVTIDRILASVGGEVLDYDATIPPGETGTARLGLDTAIITGEASVPFGVFAERGEEPTMILTLEVQSVPMLLAKPGYARWIYVQHEEEGTIAQTLYSVDAAEFQIVKVETPMPTIEVSYRPARPEERIEKVEGSQWRIEATLDSGAPVGPITGHLAVHTTHPEQKVARIPLSGFVRPVVYVTPPETHLGMVEGPRKRRLTYRVRSFSREPVAVVGAEIDLPGASTDVEATEPGRRYRIVVELDPGAMKEGPFAGELRLKTDSEKVPVLTVDLTGAIVDSGRNVGPESQGRR